MFAGWQLVEFLRTGIPLVMLQFQYQQLNILLNTHSLLQLISRNIQLFSQTTISMLQVGILYKFWLVLRMCAVSRGKQNPHM